jgi:hypothetical protein
LPAAGNSRRPLDIRTFLSDDKSGKGAEFERRVQRLAKANALSCFFIADKGKGSAKMCRDLRSDAEEL